MSCLTSAFATVNAVTGDFAPRGGARILAAFVLGAEGAVLGLAALAYSALGVVGDADGRELSFGVAALTALAAVGLLLLARGLWNARRWATSPALTWQVLQGFVAAYAISVGSAVPGAVAIALAVVGAVSIVLVSREQASPA